MMRDRPRHVQKVFLQNDAFFIVDVGIGEIDTEDAVVVERFDPSRRVQIPARRGQSFRRIADSIPVIADSF
jgi:hypothetical protein